MFKFVCFAIFLVLISAKPNLSPRPSPNQNKQAAAYIQGALLQGAGITPMHGSPSKGLGRSGWFYGSSIAKPTLRGATGQRGGYYRPSVSSGLPTVAACPDVKCHLALTIVLDSSGSVGQEDFTKELAFTRAVIEILTVKAKEVDLKVCIGIVKYSSNAEATVTPCCEMSMCQIIEKFVKKEIIYSSGSTNTAGALKVARQMLQATSSYKKIVLLVTDGRSNVGGSPAGIAKSMRDEDDITILALGVTDSINQAELMSISGDKTVRQIEDFDDFGDLADLLLESNQMTSEELSSNIDDICAKDKPKMKNAIHGEWGNWTDSYCRKIYKRMAIIPSSTSSPYRHSYRCVQIKTRQCNNPAPQCGGASCKGKTESYERCECPRPIYYGSHGSMVGPPIRPSPPAPRMPYSPPSSSKTTSKSSKKSSKKRP